MPPTRGIAGGPTISSRDPTPAREEPNEINYDSTHRIQLTFKINQKGRVILKDSSTWGTAVGYSGQAKEEVRHHFT
jgi:hypothetical protein